MARVGLRPYRSGDLPRPGSAPATAIVLTQDEAVNIERCLASLAWLNQIVVVDSGSTDGTRGLARAAGAEVVQEPWRGYGAQREFALRLPQLRHDWILFVDADEWAPTELAVEVSDLLAAPRHAAYALRRRLLFQGRWIRHCGWYQGSWLVRLMRRANARFDSDVFGERAQVDGAIGRLRNDLVDEDLKGLASWLRKHVGYAELEAQRRRARPPLRERWRRFRANRARDTTPLPRAIARELVFPSVPARPLSMFCYMYLWQRGFLDGAAGLRFCLFHAWFQLTVDTLVTEAARTPPSLPQPAREPSHA